MKKKNGFTLVELIVSFALITVISLSFFKTVLTLQEQQLKNIARNNLKTFTVVLNNSIQKDFINNKIEKIISCGDSCYDITYTKNGIVRLELDKEKNIITYGNLKEKLPTDYKFIGDIEFTSYINSYEGYDSYIALNINVKSNYESNIDNIKYVYQYDSDNKIIELDVDGAEASDIIEYLLYESPEENGLYEPLLPNRTSTGIRYRGENPNNYVYFNCEDTYNDIIYGSEGYDYENACEVWRIIGVFDVDDGEGNIEKRVKLVNTASTFQASWDSSANTVNSGYGVNQWGATDAYEGADLMRLLNGYYIGKSQVCGYNTEYQHLEFARTCTMEELKNSNLKPLSSNSLNIIDNVLWYTYAVVFPENGTVDISYSNAAYLQERGITKKYTGCKMIESTTTLECEKDNIKRNNEWKGLIGLMYVSDITYAYGWLYNKTTYPWTISPLAHDSYSNYGWCSFGSYSYYVNNAYAKGVSPSLYLKSNVTFIGDGNGTKDNPYILGINE